ncbi:C6 zinc finger domain containing protein [Phlyctema vagabunda]|uniref:C6 zinc finger domain containing protein n=1 Tax=Phlyctema vagabunda TaxID=108571 RepID=A0ABR4P5Z3_9HELO
MDDVQATATKDPNATAKNARKSPKSRKGCLRCKAKRLKCDERKPQCYQCNRKHITCPGYATQPFVWSTKHEKVLVTNPDEPMPSSTKELIQEAEKSLVGDQKRDSPTASPAAITVQQTEPVVEEAADTDVRPANTSTNSQQLSSSALPSDSLAAIRNRLSQSNVPEFLIHVPTMLVEHYFDKVCTIFSSFDGTLNPFRSTVGRLWDGSAPIYYAIQSMAAAYLANHFPRMASVGVQMQRETYKCLYQGQQAGKENTDLDKTLLTVLLVGQTTSWHDSRDLGLLHLKTAKRINRKRREQQIQLGSSSSDRALQRQNEFFDQCIVYWDMLAGFVEGIDEFDSSEAGASYNTIDTTSSAIEGNGRVFPHPWTGVAPRVQQLFAQVGRLIRSFRRVNAQDATSLNFLSLDLGFDIAMPQDSIATIEATLRAQALEEELLSTELPPLSNLVDAGDANTPVDQYLLLAEAYRCAALLEIYRVFPSILLKRTPSVDGSMGDSPATDLDDPITDQFSSVFPVPPTQPPNDFLISLALHVITLLEKIPSNSGTRCLQPIVVIAAGSELRFSAPSNDPLSTFPPQTSSIFNSITAREIDVAHARRFVLTRLQEFQQGLPAKPYIKAQQVIQETWARADLGQDVYWMDVMEELGAQTIFG